MSERPSRPFDYVQSMRQARDWISSQIEDMRFDELVEWLRVHRYTDPLLQRLADKAAQRTGAADRPAAGC